MIKNALYALKNYSTNSTAPFNIAQFTTIGVVSIISSGITSLFLNVSLLNGAAFILLAFVVFKLTKPYFTTCFSECTPDKHQPFIFVLTQWTTALATADIICALFGAALGIGQIVIVSATFLLTDFAKVLILNKLGQCVSDKAPVKKTQATYPIPNLASHS